MEDAANVVNIGSLHDKADRSSISADQSLMRHQHLLIDLVFYAQFVTQLASYGSDSTVCVREDLAINVIDAVHAGRIDNLTTLYPLDFVNRSSPACENSQNTSPQNRNLSRTISAVDHIGTPPGS